MQVHSHTICPMPCYIWQLQTVNKTVILLFPLISSPFLYLCPLVWSPLFTTAHSRGETHLHQWPAASSLLGRVAWTTRINKGKIVTFLQKPADILACLTFPPKKGHSIFFFSFKEEKLVDFSCSSFFFKSFYSFYHLLVVGLWTFPSIYLCIH